MYEEHYEELSISISEKFKAIVRDLDVRLAFFSLNKFHKFLKMDNNPLPNKTRMNVYKMHCKDCDASYVGQTGRTLKTRITEHQNDIRRNTDKHSAWLSPCIGRLTIMTSIGKM